MKALLYGPAGEALLVEAERSGRMVEVVRSFSFKLNLGNYQSCDFFCSEKSSCREDEAEDLSLALYSFCRSEVMKSVREVQSKNERKVA